MVVVSEKILPRSDNYNYEIKVYSNRDKICFLSHKLPNQIITNKHSNLFKDLPANRLNNKVIQKHRCFFFKVGFAF